MLQLSEAAVDAFDWAVVACAGVLFTAGVFGATFTLPLCTSPRGRHAVAGPHFCCLWASRFLSQVVVTLLAAAQVLRLQVLWGPRSAVIPGGYYPATFCRVFTAATYGLLEPTFLLLTLFSCLYSVKAHKFSTHPNSNIVLFSIAFSLPTCAAQLVCALFTPLIRATDDGTWLYRTLFNTYDSQQTSHCPTVAVQGDNKGADGGAAAAARALLQAAGAVLGADGESDSGNCAFCTFALFSTLVSAAFALCYLAVGYCVTERVAVAVISRVLKRRLRALQILVAVLLPLGVVCRGLTVVFVPFDMGFEVLRLVNVVCTVGTALSVSYILVLRPVQEAHAADRQLLLSSPGDRCRGWWRKSLPSAAGDARRPRDDKEDSQYGHDDDMQRQGLLDGRTPRSTAAVMLGQARRSSSGDSSASGASSGGGGDSDSGAGRGGGRGSSTSGATGVVAVRCSDPA